MTKSHTPKQAIPALVSPTLASTAEALWPSVLLAMDAKHTA